MAKSVVIAKLSLTACVVVGVALREYPADAKNYHSESTYCGAGTGNQCGTKKSDSALPINLGNGNAMQPGPQITIARPLLTDRQVFVTQIGGDNRASVSQASPHAYTKIIQNGDRNNSEVVQDGPAAAYADIHQSGIANNVHADQSGTSAVNTLYVLQSGTGNTIDAVQSATVEANGAALSQTGNANQISLDQSGGDNLARLTQEGNANVMSVSQSGVGNRLAWTQQGVGLSNLSISQSGGQSATISQSK